MLDGRLDDVWDRHADLKAWLANLEAPKGKQIKPDDCNGYKLAKRKELERLNPMPVDSKVLKKLFNEKD